MNEEKWNEMFDSSCGLDCTKFIQFLLDTGIDINALNKYGKTMLNCAAECGNLEMIKHLLEKGADGNILNSDGSNALQIADKKGHKEVVKFFLDKGMFIDCCDNCK